MAKKTQNKKERNKNSLKEIVARERARTRFTGNVKIEEKSGHPSFDGVISRFEDIALNVNCSYPHKPVRRDISDEKAFDSASEQLIGHEILHKCDERGAGCPKNEDLEMRTILTPIAKVLASKGLPNIPFGTQGHTLYTYFANLFEDVGVNILKVRDSGSPTGLFCLYDDMADGEKVNPMYEAFLKIQALLIPRKNLHGISLLKKQFRNDKKTNQAVRNFMFRSGLDNVADKARYFSNEANWERLSTIFTEELSELIDKKDMEKSFFILLGGNDLACFNDPLVQEGLSINAYNSAKKGGQGVFTPPLFIPNNLSLLALYRRLAKNIQVKTTAHSEKVEMPVAYIEKRKFNPVQDNLDRVGFGLNSRGKLEMQITDTPLFVSAGYHTSPDTFPEIRFGVLDASSSTQCPVNNEVGKGIILNPWASATPHNLQWSDTSIYHHELLCFFGLVELFKRHGTLKKSNVKLYSFSNETREAKNLGEAERLALEPEFQGTYLQKEAVERFFSGRNSLVYTISDGEIANWDSRIREENPNESDEDYAKVPILKDYFIENARLHNYFHLQIGSRSQMASDIEEAGFKVVYDNGQRAASMLIDLTEKLVYKKTKTSTKLI